MWCGAARPEYPPNKMTPVSVAWPLAKLKPSQVWWCAPAMNAKPPKWLAPPPSNVTPPRVWARTVTARVRDPNRFPIHSELLLVRPAGLTR